MSVIQVQDKGNGILGTLGTLATLGGEAMGVPWLGLLGTGMTAADTLINGNSGDYMNQSAAKGDLGKVLKQLKDMWVKPSDNNVAKSTAKQATEFAQRIVNGSNSTDAELAAKWGYPNGYYTTPGWNNSTGWRY